MVLEDAAEQRRRPEHKTQGACENPRRANLWWGEQATVTVLALGGGQRRTADPSIAHGSWLDGEMVSELVLGNRVVGTTRSGFLRPGYGTTTVFAPASGSATPKA